MKHHRRCPACRRRLPIESKIIFGSDHTVKCGFCNAVVLAASAKEEREPVHTGASWQKNNAHYDCD